MQKIRTTIRVERDLHKKARRTALEKGKSFQELVEDGLKTVLQRKNLTKRQRIRIPTFHLGKIKGRLDRTSLYDYL